MSDVLLGHSYYLRFDPKLWATMQPYPPLGTLYAAGYLRERGHDVAVFDAMLASSEADWDEALTRHRPRYAVLFEDNFNYLSKMCMQRMREAAVRMIRNARSQGCTVIVCGADATDHPGVYLGAGAQYVLLGEGEETLGELLGVLGGESDADVGSILGLAWAESPGTVRSTERRPVMRDLDRLPLPAWDLVDMASYRSAWEGTHGSFSLNMVTTRGCPYHCNWCAKPIWGQRYNARSPENVVAELRLLKSSFGPDHIWFMDDILGLSPGWMGRFAALVESEDVRTPFKCLSRADLLLRGDAVAALRRAGARTVWIGAESGSQKILDAMDKGQTVEQLVEACTRLRAAGIEVGLFIQFGYPGETWEDIRATFRMIWRCRPDNIGVSVSYPLPGTKFYERVAHELGPKRHWHDSNDLAMLYRGPFSTRFYRTLHLALHREFQLRRAWNWVAHPMPGRRRRDALRSLIGSSARATTLPLLWLRLRGQRRAQEREGGGERLRGLVLPVARITSSPPAEPTA